MLPVRAIWATLLAALAGHLVVRYFRFPSALFDIFTLSPTESETVVEWPAASLSPMGKYAVAAVAADNQFCSEIGRNILIRGGNAVDAAIATTVCIGVMDAHSAGLGGGHFMTFYQRSEKKCHVIDARVRASLKMNEYVFEDVRNSSGRGWKSITVPGEIHGLYTAYQQFASHKLPWSALLQPSIDLLTNGYPVSDAMAKALRIYRDDVFNEPTLHIFTNNKTGELYKTGEIMTRPVLANTLRKLANAPDPIAEFYINGDVQKNFLKDLKSNGAVIDEEDLQQYRSIVRDQNEIIYTDLGDKANLRICGPPPPSAAALVHSLLNVMFKFYPEPARFIRTFDSEELVYHRFVEAMKFIFARRGIISDMDFIPEALVTAQNMTTDAFAEWIKGLITDTVHPLTYYLDDNPTSAKSDTGTTHISIVDADGNAVSLTTTIFHYFGAKRRSESTGVIPSDSMESFSIPGDDKYSDDFPPPMANFVQPGKRPMTSMSPNVVFNRTSGEVELVLGAAGGYRIISSTAHVAIRMLLFNESVKEAVDAPRFHNQLLPNTTSYDEGFPKEFVERLLARGQLMEMSPTFNFHSVVMAIRKGDDSLWYANSDIMKGTFSTPAGF